MKSFRLSLGRRDRKLILRLAAVAYRLRLVRLSIWLNMKVQPFGPLIASFQLIELMTLNLMGRIKDNAVVVKTESNS